MTKANPYRLERDRLVRVIESSTSEVYIFRSDDFRFVFANTGAQENLGYSAAELRDMTPLDIKPDFDGAAFQLLIRPLLDGSTRQVDFQTVHRRRDGTHYDASIRLQLMDESEPALFYAAVQDVTERVATERQLVQTSRRLNAVLENTMMAVFLMDTRQHCVYMNKAAEEMTGYTLSETTGRPLHDVIHHTHPDGRPFPIEDCAIDRALPREMQVQGREVFVHRDGSFYPVGFTASPIRDENGNGIGTVIEARNITDDLRAEEAARAFNDSLAEQVEGAIAEREALTLQLIQSQKMEAIGKLTGGIAHDFNNLLQVIGGNLQLLSKELAGNDHAQARIGNALAGVSRGSKLASQLLSFGRRQPLQPTVINIGKLVRSMDDMLRRAIGEAVEVETVIAGGLWNTEIDATQLENALLNLALNSRDALNGPGKLTIEASNGFLDDAYAREHADVVAGQYVVIAVTDNGPGMSQDVQRQAFDPFFSTKAEGQGTGLGLSMVYGFVKQSGGHIKIYSEPGDGTTVRMYLPRSTDPETVPRPKKVGAPVGGSETILVVEDDEDVRDTVVAMLSDLGYKVVKAKDADSALTIVESGLPIDLLFTDVVMPGKLRSPELARIAQRQFPGIKVLFTSGYTQNAIVHGGKLDENVELLSKPYSRDELGLKIRSVLGPAKKPAAERPRRLRVLIVEDEPLILVTAVDMVEDLGHEVQQAMTVAEAERILAGGSIDLLMVDLGLPDGSGQDLADAAQRKHPRLRVLIASGQQLSLEGEPAMAAISKPYSEKQIAAAIAQLFGKQPEG